MVKCVEMGKPYTNRCLYNLFINIMQNYTEGQIPFLAKFDEFRFCQVQPTRDIIHVLINDGVNTVWTRHISINNITKIAILL